MFINKNQDLLKKKVDLNNIPRGILLNTKGKLPKVIECCHTLFIACHLKDFSYLISN